MVSEHSYQHHTFFIDVTSAAFVILILVVADKDIIFVSLSVYVQDNFLLIKTCQIQYRVREFD